MTTRLRASTIGGSGKGTDGCSGVLRDHGKRERAAGAAAGVVVKGDAAAVLGDDALDDGETQAGTGVGLSGYLPLTAPNSYTTLRVA